MSSDDVGLLVGDSDSSPFVHTRRLAPKDLTVAWVAENSEFLYGRIVYITESISGPVKRALENAKVNLATPLRSTSQENTVWFGTVSKHGPFVYGYCDTVKGEFKRDHWAQIDVHKSMSTPDVARLPALSLTMSHRHSIPMPFAGTVSVYDIEGDVTLDVGRAFVLPKDSPPGMYPFALQISGSGSCRLTNCPVPFLKMHVYCTVYSDNPPEVVDLEEVAGFDTEVDRSAISVWRISGNAGTPTAVPPNAQSIVMNKSQLSILTDLALPPTLSKLVVTGTTPVHLPASLAKCANLQILSVPPGSTADGLPSGMLIVKGVKDVPPDIRENVSAALRRAEAMESVFSQAKGGMEWLHGFVAELHEQVSGSSPVKPAAASSKRPAQEEDRPKARRSLQFANLH